MTQNNFFSLETAEGLDAISYTPVERLKDPLLQSAFAHTIDVNQFLLEEFKELVFRIKSNQDLKTTFDHYFQKLTQSNGQLPLLKSLPSLLTHVRSEMTLPEWRAFIKNAIWTHPIIDLFHQEPCTKRSFDKPRGYAGDAVTLDYLYGITRLKDGASETEKNLFQFMFESEAAKALRSRYKIIGNRLQDIVAHHPTKPRVLSVACGHAPELGLLPPELKQKLEFVGMDGDLETLTTLHSRNPDMPFLQPLHLPLLGLIKQKNKIGEFDFIYSSGLYDYLEEPIAQKLTRHLFNLLKPGGRLLITNFGAVTKDIGYMEAFMDWFLIYRTEKEMLNIVPSSFEENIDNIKIFTDSRKQIVFSEIKKRE